MSDKMSNKQQDLYEITKWQMVASVLASMLLALKWANLLLGLENIHYVQGQSDASFFFA